MGRWILFVLMMTHSLFKLAPLCVGSGTLRWDTIVPTPPSFWLAPNWIWEMTRTPWTSWRRRNSARSRIPKDWPWPRRLVISLSLLSFPSLRRQCASYIEPLSVSDPQVPSSTWSAQPWLSVALKLCLTRPFGPSSVLQPWRKRVRSARSSETSLLEQLQGTLTPSGRHFVKLAAETLPIHTQI